MNLTLAAVLGLAVSQPPAPEVHTTREKSFKLPIRMDQKDAKNVRNVLLFVSVDQGGTWTLESKVTPDRTHFPFAAKKDGPHWFQIVTEDLAGKQDPSPVTAEPPALKLLIDTTPPVLRVKTSRRLPDKTADVVMEWSVDEKYPDDTATRVHFRPVAAPDSAWQEVSLPATSKFAVQFPAPAVPLVVRVAVRDLAGNEAVAVREIGLAEATPPTANMNPPASAPPPPMGLVPETQPTAGPLAPNVPTIQPAPVNTQPAAPTFTAANTTAQTFLAVSSGTTATAPTVEVSRAQVVNYLRFDMAYEVEQRGPSGISRADLWVTRDDGRTWARWSQHDGRESSVRVVLDNRGNVPREQLEGAYGFRVVPISGAGLSEASPQSGDAADMKVVVDLTPPVVGILPPGSDPTQRDTLEIRWEATDRNFGEDPISLEWSESAAGPWRPVLSGGSDGVVQATAVSGLTARRIPNTGKYAWRVPVGLPPKVYLKVTARDAAGNVSEVVTPQPITIDLTKPKARIVGIGATRP